MSRGVLTVCLLWIVLGAWHGDIACGQARDADRADTVKAGVLLNFIKYTEWPDEKFAEPQSPVVVTFVGESPFLDELQRAVRAYNNNPNRQSRLIEVSVARHPASTTVPGSQPSQEQLDSYFEQLRESHVVFFSGTESGRVRDSLARLSGSDVLTVSDVSGFAEAGGMLGMVVHDERIAFDANQQAIQASKVKVSSKVLRLARRIVQTRP